MGLDSDLWSFATEGLLRGDLEPLVSTRRQILYPALSALPTALLGAAAGHRVVSTLAIAAGAILAFSLLQRSFGRTAGVLGSAAYLAHPDVLPSAVSLNADGLAFPLLLLVAWTLVMHREAPSLGRALSVGCALGLAALARPSLLLVLPVTGLLILTGSGTRSARLTQLAACCAMLTPFLGLMPLLGAITGVDGDGVVSGLWTDLLGAGTKDTALQTITHDGGFGSQLPASGPSRWRAIILGNLYREAVLLLQTLPVLWLSVFAWSQRRSATVLVLVGLGISFLLATGLLWQMRHASPFVLALVLAVIGGASPRLWRGKRWLAGLALIGITAYCGNALLGVDGRMRFFTQGPGACSEPLRAMAQRIRGATRADPSDHGLVVSGAGLSVLAGIPLYTGPLPGEGGSDRGTLWSIAGPRVPISGTLRRRIARSALQSPEHEVPPVEDGLRLFRWTRPETPHSPSVGEERGSKP